MERLSAEMIEMLHTLVLKYQFGIEDRINNEYFSKFGVSILDFTKTLVEDGIIPKDEFDEIMILFEI